MTIIQKPIWTNYEKGRNGKHPELICIHIIGLPGITAESAYEHFSNPASEVSAHYIIKRTGEIWQLILDSDTAWANGSISFKNGKPILPTNPIAKRCWQTGVRINQVSLSIENEGSEYEDITPAQYESNVFLIKELSRKFNIPIDSTHICGHREIKHEKLCPGRISVGKIIAMANAPIAPVAPTIPAVAYTTATFVVNPPLLPTAIPNWLSNLIYRTQNKLGNIIWGDRMFGAARDSGWAKESRAYLKIHNVSELSGKKGTWTNPLVIHHVIPVSRDKSKEMDKSNWVVLTTWEHLVFAHLGSWLSYNPTLRADIEVWKKKYDERP